MNIDLSGRTALVTGSTDASALPTFRAAFVKANGPSSIIGRAASTEEVANMIVYVCSPQASATTGAALRVDGGVIDTLM